MRRVIEVARGNPGAIVVPRHERKRGHPVYLPWATALAIRLLPQGLGVKHLFEDASRPVVEIDWEASLKDVDTPEEYDRWVAGTSH